MTAVGGKRNIKPGSFWSIPERHTQDVSEVYMILGDLTVEIILDGKGHGANTRVHSSLHEELLWPTYQQRNSQTTSTQSMISSQYAPCPR
jgi:hypothetical protein